MKIQFFNVLSGALILFFREPELRSTAPDLLKVFCTNFEL
jgi:hypothetical protein